MKKVSILALLLALVLCLGACTLVKDIDIFQKESETQNNMKESDVVVVPEEYGWTELGLFELDYVPNISETINLENPSYFAFTLSEKTVVKISKNSTGLSHYIYKDEGAYAASHVACDLGGEQFSVSLEQGTYFLVCDSETEELLYNLVMT